jgi:hypothetical protein
VSDLYLDLRRRIPVVTEWTDVGSEDMERAQDRTGLSDERLARLIPVSAKTWVRWKRRGAIPTHLLPKVAPILGFELVSPTLTQLEVGGTLPADLRESLAVLIDLVRSIDQRLADIERAMPALPRSHEIARRSP